MAIFKNIGDLKTTLPGLWLALHTFLLSFGYELPVLPSWVPMAISGLSVLYLTFFVKSHPESGVVNALTPAS